MFPAVSAAAWLKFIGSSSDLAKLLDKILSQSHRMAHKCLATILLHILVLIALHKITDTDFFLI